MEQERPRSGKIIQMDEKPKDGMAHSTAQIMSRHEIKAF